jgi:hypothetical protein
MEISGIGKPEQKYVKVGPKERGCKSVHRIRVTRTVYSGELLLTR